MNLPPRLAALLTDEGFEAVHWSQLGHQDAPDVEIMAYARAHGLTVLTHDLDFGSILAATGADKPSVVQIRAQDLTPELLLHPLARGLRLAATELAEGALLSIDSARSRVRLLPLGRS